MFRVCIDDVDDERPRAIFASVYEREASRVFDREVANGRFVQLFQGDKLLEESCVEAREGS